MKPYYQSAETLDVTEDGYTAEITRLDVREYRKTATVRAGRALRRGTIPTLEGIHSFEEGDYIAGPGADGEFWPVKRHIFERTYVETGPHLGTVTVEMTDEAKEALRRAREAVDAAVTLAVAVQKAIDDDVDGNSGPLQAALEDFMAVCGERAMSGLTRREKDERVVVKRSLFEELARAQCPQIPVRFEWSEPDVDGLVALSVWADYPEMGRINMRLLRYIVRAYPDDEPSES